jgi:hypothetical protein
MSDMKLTFAGWAVMLIYFAFVPGRKREEEAR